jgi:hypothetical protein
MSDFLSKIENFLFDLLGLALPGAILLFILISPVCFLDINQLRTNDINDSFILSELVTMNRIIKAYWNSDKSAIIFFFLTLSYLVGHAVKIFSIIKYSVLTALFDNSINKGIIFLYKKLGSRINNLFLRLFHRDVETLSIYGILKDLLKPIREIIKYIFVFHPEPYMKENDSLRTKCIELINSRLNTNFPDKWYSLYKISTVLQQQENIKSLSGTFLAKYNFYRSISFISIFTTVYYFLFFSASSLYLTPELKKIATLLISSSILLWFTFHIKYKRYWTLCGNETLVSLFYFLNKKKLNET